MDMSKRRCVLQCLNHLGCCRSRQNVYQSRNLPRNELVLPNRLPRAFPSLAAFAKVPRKAMDQLHSHAYATCRRIIPAFCESCALFELGSCWYLLQLLHLQKIQRLVGKTYLYLIGCNGCWCGFYGCFPLFHSSVKGYLWSFLLGYGQ